MSRPPSYGRTDWLRTRVTGADKPGHPRTSTGQSPEPDSRCSGASGEARGVDDPGLLRRWLARAATAPSAEIFGEGGAEGRQAAE
ncbi:hypothetical protein [Streptomyces viridochromogenes]|uniref:hypothetical protein n=1 Tax=Streptomyces viridochromogenes TaxID=1938 RepID=UPI000A371DCE|nr:hypothetical protein [Streptomyces viridochromogenes]